AGAPLRNGLDVLRRAAARSPGRAAQIHALFKPPVPFDQKKTALAYINSNCGAKSGRSDIMRKVIALKNPIVPTESWGHCDRNMKVAGAFNKVELIHGYKFCVAMENSITKDYITEKLWQALEAGCVPVYMGPHNVDEFLPDPEAIINYHKLGSPEALNKELERLASDRGAYEAKLAWKFKAWKDLAPAFLAMTERSHVRKPHSRCQICQLALRHRVKPQKYTTCLFNETWTKDYHVKA
ncbi:putative fucosyltransferase-like protein, partial [Tetrabaena socialis]